MAQQNGEPVMRRYVLSHSSFYQPCGHASCDLLPCCRSRACAMRALLCSFRMSCSRAFADLPMHFPPVFPRLPSPSSHPAPVRLHRPCQLRKPWQCAIARIGAPAPETRMPKNSPPYILPCPIFIDSHADLSPPENWSLSVTVPVVRLVYSAYSPSATSLP